MFDDIDEALNDYQSCLGAAPPWVRRRTCSRRIVRERASSSSSF
jgi:hypothetical protein